MKYVLPNHPLAADLIHIVFVKKWAAVRLNKDCVSESGSRISVPPQCILHVIFTTDFMSPFSTFVTSTIRPLLVWKNSVYFGHGNEFLNKSVCFQILQNYDVDLN